MKISYEKLCHIFGFLPINLKNQKLQKAIDFCELNVTTQQVYSLAIVLPLLLIFLGILSSIVVPTSIVGIYILLCVFLMYYLYRYPITLQRSLRIQLASEMVTAVIYMAASLRETPNLERAVIFAANSLTGPLGKDLKKIAWDVYEGKYTSMDEALARYSLKWKDVSEEFSEALNMLRNYSRKGALEEAVSLVTGGTRDKMKDYAFELRNPVRLIDALGFTFPLVALTLAPILILLLPFQGASLTFAAIYVVFLPLSLYWLIKISLEKRPWTFPRVDISEHPEKIPEAKIKFKNFLVPALPLSILVGALVATPGILFLFQSKEFHFTNVFLTVPITWGIVIAICIYFFSYRHNLKIIEEVKKTEEEFTSAVYILGDKLATGVPLETSLEKTAKSLSGLRIAQFFEKTVYNIKMFGMTLEKALFDPNSGSVRYFPSKTIKSIMKILSDAVKKNVIGASKVAMWIYQHLKLMHATEENVRDTTEEATSAMQIECYALAPFTCGIIVAFAALVMNIMVILGELFKEFTASFTGIPGAITSGALSMFANVNQMIAPEYFQIIVGIYLIEIIYLLSMFQSKLENGEDKHAQNILAAKYLLVAASIYTLTILVTTMIFNALLPLARLVV